MYFNNATGVLSLLFPSLEWKINTNKKEIFLTFDDGPVPQVTEFVLEQLEKYRAKATFFCVGDNIRKHPEIFKKIYKNGHSCGNHTFHHKNGWKTGDKEYFDNIAQCADVMKREGYLPHGKQLFRPPYGKIKRSQIAQLKDDYRIIMWNVLTGDFNPDLDKEKCLQKALKYTQSGSIVIFHDSYKAEKNMAFALPRFLEFYSEKGYSFKAL